MASDVLAELRRIAEEMKRLPPPLVIQVNDYMPDDVFVDFTALQKQTEEWFARDGWVMSNLPKPKHEQRVLMNGRTLDKVRREHPEMFGPFGVKVEYPKRSDDA